MTVGDYVNPIEPGTSIIPVNIRVKSYRDESQLLCYRVTPKFGIARNNLIPGGLLQYSPSPLL